MSPNFAASWILSIVPAKGKDIAIPILYLHFDIYVRAHKVNILRRILALNPAGVKFLLFLNDFLIGEPWNQEKSSRGP